MKELTAKQLANQRYYQKHKTACNERSASWVKNNRDKHRLSDRQSKLRVLYGITPEKYEDMLCAQGACCDICGVKFNCESGGSLTPHVDHDHTTMAVRGLLCKRCNTVLGTIEKVGADAFINYLQRGKLNDCCVSFEGGLHSL